jgi:hypothetical protein
VELPHQIREITPSHPPPTHTRSRTSTSLPRQNVQVLLGVLDHLKDQLIPAHPAVANAQSRFGNPAFRDWYDAMEVGVPVLLRALMPLPAPLLAAEVGPTSPNTTTLSHDEGLAEAAEYLVNSFGNRKRIDYGTGHEVHFIAFLLTLTKLGVVGEADLPALVLRVFWSYIGVMRALQREYWLEPAGSHGVWGLDDYHFLPFLFGSAQLYGMCGVVACPSPPLSLCPAAPLIFVNSFSTQHHTHTHTSRYHPPHHRPQAPAPQVHPGRRKRGRLCARVHVLCVHRLHQLGQVRLSPLALAHAG